MSCVVEWVGLRTAWSRHVQSSRSVRYGFSAQQARSNRSINQTLYLVPRLVPRQKDALRGIDVLRRSSGSSDPGGVLGSLDDDGAQYWPVGFAGVEQCADAVVVEVAEPEADAFDPLDQVVQRLGGSVAEAGAVEVADRVEPLLEGPAAFA